MTDLNYVEAMRVGQGKIHEGDVRWHVLTANGFIVRGPYLNREQADGALANIRRLAHEEAQEEGAWPEDAAS